LFTVDRYRTKIQNFAHALIVATAIALPWSTSAVSILLALWVVTILTVCEWKHVTVEICTPQGALPVALFLMALLGIIWSNASATERVEALTSFVRLLALPLIASQYRLDGRGRQVLRAFLASIIVLLPTSFLFYFLPHLRPQHVPGVPVKDYIVQSFEFAICISILLDFARNALASGAYWRFGGIAILMFAFIANICFVATARTTLIVLMAIVLLYGLRYGGWKGLLVALSIALVTFGAALGSSKYLKSRVVGVYSEIQMTELHNAITSSGARLIFWREAIDFISHAPLLGHGTGSIRELYARASGTSAVEKSSTNPHNQTLTVGIQLGLVGIALLWAMWISEITLFWNTGSVAWVGTTLVSAIVVGSLFNSFVFDFTEGWLYVLGVGMATGMHRRAKSTTRKN
jgi:O-antigen ligase